MAKEPDLKELVEEIEDIVDDTHDLNPRKAGCTRRRDPKATMCGLSKRSSANGGDVVTVVRRKFRSMTALSSDTTPCWNERPSTWTS